MVASVVRVAQGDLAAQEVRVVREHQGRCIAAEQTLGLADLKGLKVHRDLVVRQAVMQIINCSKGSVI